MGIGDEEYFDKLSFRFYLTDVVVTDIVRVKWILVN